MDHPRELLKAEFIATMDGRAKVHRLNPNAQYVTKSLGDAVGLTQLGVHVITVMPGHDSTEYHRHLYEEECIYIISGRGHALIDDKSYAVGVGDFLGYPRDGIAHALTNTGDEPLVCLVAGQRLEQDVCEYPHKNKRLYINGAVEDLVDMDNIIRKT